MKEKILKLIELKIRLIEAEKEHENEIEEAIKENNYCFNEGYKSDAMEQIDEYTKAILEIDI